MIIGTTDPGSAPSLPYGGGQFRCGPLGRCVPADGTALGQVMVLNRILGIQAAPQNGIDMVTVRAVETALGGQATGLHVPRTAAQLARVIGEAIQTITLVRQQQARRRQQDLEAGAASAAAVALFGGLGAAPSPSAQAAFRAAINPKIPPNRPQPKSVLTKPKQKPPAEPRPRLSRDQVARLQRALTYAGHAVKEDGKLGPQTLAAVRNWQAARGRISEVENTTYETIAVFYASLMKQLVAGNAGGATAQFNARPSADTKAQATVQTQARQVVLPPGAKPIGDFSCKNGVCTPMSEQAAKTAVALQQQLMGMPATVTRSYPRAFKVDGKIGLHTVDALRVVLQAAAKRQGTALPAEALKLDAQKVSAALDKFLTAVETERKLQFAAAQGGAGSDIGPGLVFKQLKNGTAVGNEAFRCFAMALQVQLNRMGQKLGVDGVIGANTAASVNRVFGAYAQKMRKPWNAVRVQEIASGLRDMIATAKQIADQSGAPAPDARTMKAAVAKCKLETAQPTVDARLFKGEPVRISTPAPPPVPTPAPAQPLPKVNAANVPDPVATDVQGLVTEAIYRGVPQPQAQMIGDEALRAGLTRPQIIDLLNRAIASVEAMKNTMPPASTGAPPPVNEPSPPVLPPGLEPPEEALPPEVALPPGAAMAPPPPVEELRPSAAEAPRSGAPWGIILGTLGALGVLGTTAALAMRPSRAR